MPLLPLLPFFALLSPCESYGPQFEIVRRPLELAAERGDMAEVERLIAAGADIDGADGTFSPLTQAASRPEQVEIIRKLLAAGANPEGRGRRDGVCWVSHPGRATSAGNVEGSRALLEAGAILDSKCNRSISGYFTPPINDLLVE